MYLFHIVCSIYFVYFINYIYNILFIKTLYIIRGISGSGKSYYVTYNENNNNMYNYSNDNYIELNIYNILNKDNKDEKITSMNLVKAYNKCLTLFIINMYKKTDRIYVTNPFIYKWEYKNYILLAKLFNYKVKMLEYHCDNNDDLQKCFKRSINLNNFNIIKNQYDNFEKNENCDEILKIE